MEVSTNANADTIERVFRYLGQRFHPDNTETGNDERFRRLLSAYTTLRDAESRAAYDARLRQHREQQSRIVDGAAASGSDTMDRHKLLSLFYGQRRRDMKNPGVGPTALEQILGCPREVLEFHIWYFREKSWIKREESGLFAITVAGIDEIESSHQSVVPKDHLITMRADIGSSDSVTGSGHTGRSVAAPISMKQRVVAGWPPE